MKIQYLPTDACAADVALRGWELRRCINQACPEHTWVVQRAAAVTALWWVASHPDASPGHRRSG